MHRERATNIPKELRDEIFKEPKLAAAGHRELALWCRRRVMTLTSQHLAEIRKKELRSTITGRRPQREKRVLEGGPCIKSRDK